MIARDFRTGHAGTMAGRRNGKSWRDNCTVKGIIPYRLEGN